MSVEACRVTRTMSEHEGKSGFEQAFRDRRQAGRDRVLEYGELEAWSWRGGGGPAPRWALYLSKARLIRTKAVVGFL